ncbi:MalY/PatB family protein [Defluviitoga tunisiensis]|jgi:cystathionine beta-lyase|uniref:cysteine-S-conjugate beta-lyase n=1 Tax=Defluviitoga tunisiensis TaxID=1006576 RepID=A0A0C7P329_DEFTU|nr:MalY/PatB family protein [Defluviitoga tunisiensis]MDD3600179.1 pyridoxal phosphate-dependent aminotransferase [Defluviitoga tunisiensis]CEP78725.1 cystathionine beta-lyase [Defluviitoga tunisiensis]HOB54665.1 MalY/PatB family protein [Defluviitoga tunisiensis]HOP33576.1 MalY/PatB family protein [Defluviitoga tunisiensis]HPU59403.1 MalY/PatB family protein [Defluviitoga tunisiensis]
MAYDFDEIIDRRNTESEKWCNLLNIYGRNDIIPMWVADMDFKSPPEVIDVLEDRVKHGVFGYPMLKDEYIEPFIKWVFKKHTWKIDKNWVIMNSCVVDSLKTAVLTFSRPGDSIVIQPPVYRPFFNLVTSNGRTLLTNPLKIENGRYKIDFNDLEKKLSEKRTKLLLFCSPHNPVGRVWEENELRMLGELCLKYDVLILSDEIHSDIIYNNKHLPIASLSKELQDSTLSFYAPSKTFNLAGLRTSFVVIPNERIRTEYETVLSSISSMSINIFGLLAASAAYQYGEKWLDELIDYLKGNIDYVIEFFKHKLPKVTINPPEGTFLLWLDFRRYGSESFVKNILINEAHVGLEEGSIFGQEGQGFFRMNIGCPRKILVKACDNIYNAFKSLI